MIWMSIPKVSEPSELAVEAQNGTINDPALGIY
jgi:hypothetical protein